MSRSYNFREGFGPLCFPCQKPGEAVIQFGVSRQ